MKIKLTQTLPINKIHGAVEGEVFEVVREDFQGRGNNGYIFIGKAGEECKAFTRECEVINEE